MCYILFGKTFQALTITEKQEPKVNLLSTLIETKSKCTMGLLKFRVYLLQLDQNLILNFCIWHHMTKNTAKPSSRPTTSSPW